MDGRQTVTLRFSLDAASITMYVHVRTIFQKTRNAWHSLACSPHSIAVTPSSIYMKQYWVVGVYAFHPLKCLHDVARSSWKCDIAIRFRMPGRRIKVNKPISSILTLKLVDIATSLDRLEIRQILNLRSNTHLRWKYGEILNEGVQTFAPLKLWSYKFLSSAATSSQMNLLKSELRYSTPFMNVKATNEGEPAISSF